MKSLVRVIELSGEKIAAISPYHPDMPSQSKSLGGKWRSVNSEDTNYMAWVFDSRDEQAVRNLLISIYGTDGSEEGELISIRLTAKDLVYKYHGGIFYAGRCIARAYGRDSGAKLGEQVILESGKIDSGGSMKNWTTRIEGGTILIVRDIPKKALEAERDNFDFDCSIIDTSIDREALENEKKKLLERMAEIDKLLGGEAE